MICMDRIRSSTRIKISVFSIAFVVFVVFMYAHTTDFRAISDLKFRIKRYN